MKRVTNFAMVDYRWIDRIDAKRQGPEVEGQDLVVLTVWLCDR